MSVEDSTSTIIGAPEPTIISVIIWRFKPDLNILDKWVPDRFNSRHLV